MHIDDLLASLAGSRVSDVLTQGFVERAESPPRFIPLPKVWYLELESGYLRVEAVRSEAQLVMKLVDRPELPVELADEAEEFAVASHGDLFFDTAGPPLPVTRVRYATDGRSDPAHGVVRLVEFALARSQGIVFDPAWHFGIRPGPAGVFERLVADLKETGPVGESHWPV